MSNLRVAVQVAQEHADYPAIRHAAAAAEEIGADAVFNWDHFFPLGKVRTGEHFEAWTMLGAWAESTSRAQIGPLVSCAGYREPGLVAAMARTVDEISGGRFVLGVGAGFREWEFEQYGFTFGTPGERVRQVAETLAAVGSSVPVLVAGGGPKMLRLAAEHAAIWHTFADDDELDRQSTVLDGHCRDLGRDPATIERGVFVSGDPEEIGPGLIEQGVTLCTVMTFGPAYDLTEAKRWIDWRNGLDVHPSLPD